jgi:beta-aspartyl-peptidase (threonine type)
MVMKYKRPVILIHGGAGDWSSRDWERASTELIRALDRGYEQFRTGSSLAAVVEAVAYMEDSGAFDAGRGSVLNSKGEVEMDAGVMWGPDLRVGAVAATKAKNPIREALKVLREGRHVLMVNWGREEALQPGNISGDTVGAVALDVQGNLTAATSTGGIKGKLPGRVGDSPIPGAGYYATARVATSSTGIGEIILKVLPAKELDILVSMGFPVESSLELVIGKITNLFGRGTVGMIALDSSGNGHAAFNTKGMARGVMAEDVKKVAIFEGDGI